MSEASLGKTIESALSDKSVPIRDADGRSFTEILDTEPSNYDTVIDNIYEFAGRFVGHEGKEQRGERHVNALTVPLQEYLDFFAAAETIWVMANTESEQAKFLQFVKKHKMEEVKQSIGKHAERVAEALLIAVATKQSELDADTELSVLLGQFDAFLENENAVEAVIEDIIPTHITSLLAKEKVEKTEKHIERKRVRITSNIFKHIRPLLNKLELGDPIREWMHFSNEQPQ